MSNDSRFQQQWQMMDQWASIIHKWYNIPQSLVFTGSDLKTALLKDKTLKLEMQRDDSKHRPSGIFHSSYKPGSINMHGF